MNDKEFNKGLDLAEEITSHGEDIPILQLSKILEGLATSNFMMLYRMARAFLHLNEQTRPRSVEDELPMQRQRVLVKSEEFGDAWHDKIHYYLEGRGFYRYSIEHRVEGVMSDENITHWWPMPRVPEE